MVSLKDIHLLNNSQLILTITCILWACNPIYLFSAMGYKLHNIWALSKILKAECRHIRCILEWWDISMECNNKNQIDKVKICNRIGICKIKFYTLRIQTTFKLLYYHLLLMYSKEQFNRLINKIFKVILQLNQGIKMIKIAKI